ncbi:ParB/RepB/Spo0J family partition protein [Pseudogemmobacter bohemicus]|uniref:ParB/RepB/Spo0J family partition protein n=1 Tax=Pseudogemmobacter bohemicus TaxID=2250708 RepID=UPI001E575BB1|nr:ParB N-terminal domain-containing protein [Pseudogemmobacter bohemicus]
MTQPTLMQQSRPKVSEIIVGDRLRPVSKAGVESLIASVNETGVMKDAIHIRKKKDGKLVLIAGGHRLEAARRLGWDEVEAKIWTDVTDDWARMMEVDNNLAGAEMNALDTAVFLAERKRLYEKLHPETRAGVAGGLARQGSANELGSFAAATAEKFNLTVRQIQKIVAAGTALSRDEIRHLRAAKAPVTLKDLTEISRISEDQERSMVVLKLSGGNAKSAAAARKQLEAEEGRTPVIDPMKQSEAEFRAISAAWKRAGAAARRRFVSEEIGQEGGVE